MRDGVLQLIRRRVRTIEQEMVIRGPELDVAGHRLVVQVEVVGQGAEEDVQ